MMTDVYNPLNLNDQNSPGREKSGYSNKTQKPELSNLRERFPALGPRSQTLTRFDQKLRPPAPRAG